MTSDASQESTGRVLPMPALSPPGVTCSSSDCELLIQRLMEVVWPGRSGIQERPQRQDTGLGLQSSLCFSAIPGMDAPTRVPGLEGGMDPSSPVQLEPILEVDPPLGVGSSVFLLWSTGTWGEPILTDGHFFSLSVGWLVGWCQKWPLPSRTDECGWTELYSGKRGMVRAGGSASRIIGDRGATDPGGGKGTRGTPASFATTVGDARGSSWTSDAQVRAGGSASRIIGDRGATDPGGGKGTRGTPASFATTVGDARGSSWTSDAQAFPALGSHSSTKAGRCKRPISDTEEDVDGNRIARLPVSSPEMGDPTRGMRPAGAGSSSPLKPVVALSNMRQNALARPLSVEAPEFSPALDPRTRETSASVARHNAAGTMVPVDFAGLSVPAVPGMQFSAVAEVHSSAVDLVDGTLVVHANGQQSDGSGNPRRPPGMVDRPVTNLSDLEPLEHSVPEEDLEGEPTEGPVHSGTVRAFGSGGKSGRQAYEGSVCSGTVRAFDSGRRPGR